ncbi:3-oxoacyl-ACP synthase III family protein [Streptomyces sp. NPDC052013]|uniref:3-oxoacyl-ACP synthase III family protein n=1 Tax=Streptomyces sp. NPDC052013 TaxID=3365679 RepID=UPI0037D3490B
MSHESVGILGIGTYIPEEVRSNDYWPQRIQLEWAERRRRNAGLAAVMEADSPLKTTTSPGEQIITSELERSKGDTFQGVKERRVMPDGMASSDMEMLAAQQALTHSQIRPNDIDFILTHSLVPDRLGFPNACILQRALEVPERSLVMATEGASNSFQQQLTLGRGLIQSGLFRYGLVIQSAAPSRLLHIEDQISVTLGDGAAATVIGPVPKGYGILGSAHCSDGSINPTATCDPIGSPWYSGERNVFHVVDARQGRRMLLRVADISAQVITEALKQGGQSSSNVDFYASHQGADWMRRVTQEYSGLHRAKFVDTFSWTGSLWSANLPYQLSEGLRLGLIKDGDLVAMFSGGTGITWSSTVLRWGR